MTRDLTGHVLLTGRRECHTVRESWLAAAVERMRPLFLPVSPLPPAERIRVSCGWPSSGGGRGGKRLTIGQAWSPRASADGLHETFLSPVLAEPPVVLSTLVHELVHHAVGVEHGHRAPFRRVALSVGLVGPMRATTAGDALALELAEVALELGPYPHARMSLGDGDTRKKQRNRHLACRCPCGCVVRLTRAWLDRVGPPTCGCGERMVAELPDDEEDDGDGGGEE